MNEKQPKMTSTTIRVLMDFIEQKRPLSGADLINDLGLFSGTLYPILKRLEKAGWLTSSWEGGDPKELGRPVRRFYELTATGERKAMDVLASERTQKFFGPLGGEPIGV